MIVRLWFLLLCVLASAFAPSRACARGAENRTWVFAPTIQETRLETAPQVAGLHQENRVWGYEHAPGCTQAASIARSALGKGEAAAPGSVLTEAQLAALLKNRADTIANIERAVSNEALSPQLRERMFRLGMERVQKINETLESGVVAPKN